MKTLSTFLRGYFASRYFLLDVLFWSVLCTLWVKAGALGASLFILAWFATSIIYGFVLRTHIKKLVEEVTL